MAEELIQLGQEAGAAIAQDTNIITNEELNDVLAPEDAVADSSDADVEDVLVTTEPTSLSSISQFFATCGINLILPFINGMMLGFGEILAHELGFKYGWIGARVYPQQRMQQRLQQKSQYL